MENAVKKETALEAAVQEKISQVIDKYLDVQLAVLKRLEEGQSVEADTINAINDSIRILHHIVKIKKF